MKMELKIYYQANFRAHTVYRDIIKKLEGFYGRKVLYLLFSFNLNAHFGKQNYVSFSSCHKYWSKKKFKIFVRNLTGTFCSLAPMFLHEPKTTPW